MSTRRTLLKAGLAAPILAAGGPVMAAAKGALGAIRAVTITAPDVRVAEEAWVKHLDHKLIGRGVVSKAEAMSWGAPAVAGKPIVTLGPASGEPTYIRFVEQASGPEYDPKGTYGWNATEITVQNSDELYERLKVSAFKPDGPPRTIPTYDYLRAMQAYGPADERVYLTWIRELRPDLAVAKSFVGRVFITVASVPDLPAAIAFYKDTFGNESNEPRDLPSVKLATTRLDDGCKIELDQFPQPRKERRTPPGGLPPGLAMVSFECKGFDRFRNRLKGPAAVASYGAFKGRRTGVMSGAAGELIELIEA